MPGGMLIPWEALLSIFHRKGPVTTDPKGKAPLFYSKIASLRW
jgi:hypothetical protein